MHNSKCNFNYPIITSFVPISQNFYIVWKITKLILRVSIRDAYTIIRVKTIRKRKNILPETANKTAYCDAGKTRKNTDNLLIISRRKLIISFVMLQVHENLRSMATDAEFNFKMKDSGYFSARNESHDHDKWTLFFFHPAKLLRIKMISTNLYSTSVTITSS